MLLRFELDCLSTTPIVVEIPAGGQCALVGVDVSSGSSKDGKAEPGSTVNAVSTQQIPWAALLRARLMAQGAERGRADVGDAGALVGGGGDAADALPAAVLRLVRPPRAVGCTGAPNNAGGSSGTGLTVCVLEASQISSMALGGCTPTRARRGRQPGAVLGARPTVIPAAHARQVAEYPMQHVCASTAVTSSKGTRWRWWRTIGQSEMNLAAAQAGSSLKRGEFSQLHARRADHFLPPTPT